MNALLELAFPKETVVEQMARTLELSNSPANYLEAIDVLLEDDTNLLKLDWPALGETPELSYVREANGRVTAGQGVGNAIAIYRYLGPMTPAAASDRRLWNYLSHVTFRDYQSARWPLDAEGWKSRISDRWLLRNSTRGALVRNGISRLWWAASLTIDPLRIHKLSSDSDDEFAYLRVLLAYEDTFLAIVDRDTGMIPNLVIAVLDHIASDESNSKESYVRQLMKEVVLVAGYSELAGLSVGDASELLDTLSAQIGAR